MLWVLCDQLNALLASLNCKRDCEMEGSDVLLPCIRLKYCSDPSKRSQVYSMTK